MKQQRPLRLHDESTDTIHSDSCVSHHLYISPDTLTISLIRNRKNLTSHSLQVRVRSCERGQSSNNMNNCVSGLWMCQFEVQLFHNLIGFANELHCQFLRCPYHQGRDFAPKSAVSGSGPAVELASF